jgi:4-hydroxymandelate oxidase
VPGADTAKAELTIDDFRRLARHRLDRQVWDYLAGGADRERTLADSAAAFAGYRVRPRVLVDVSRCSTATTLLGDQLAAPYAVAPMAFHRLVHAEGELATAAGAGEAGALFVASVFASRSIEDIARVATGPLWLQLYWLRQRDVLVELAGRARAAGYRALVVTVDAPRLGRRLRDMRNGFAVDPAVPAANLASELTELAHRPRAGASAIAEHARSTFDESVTWSDLAWLRSVSPLPILVKGVLTAEDARLAVGHGAAGVVVSNHGGRQLDAAVPALRALPEIRQALAGTGVVLFDGGVRHGGDIFTALALGADAVLVGRPVLWALAVDGAPAVARMFALLREELELTMALAGRPAPDTIDPTAVVPWS